MEIWWQRREGGRRRAKEWPPTGEKANSGKGCVDGCAGGARVQAGMLSGKSKKNEGDLALNKATSRRSGQRRDVPES